MCAWRWMCNHSRFNVVQKCAFDRCTTHFCAFPVNREIQKRKQSSRNRRLKINEILWLQMSYMTTACWSIHSQRLSLDRPQDPPIWTLFPDKVPRLMSPSVSVPITLFLFLTIKNLYWFFSSIEIASWIVFVLWIVNFIISFFCIIVSTLKLPTILVVALFGF